VEFRIVGEKKSFLKKPKKEKKTKPKKK